MPEPILCQNCHNPIPAVASFCPVCGASRPPAPPPPPQPSPLPPTPLPEGYFRCPYCQQIHPNGLVFCPITAQKLRTCRRCGLALRPEWQTCPKCGTRQGGGIPIWLWVLVGIAALFGVLFAALMIKPDIFGPEVAACIADLPVCLGIRTTPTPAPPPPDGLTATPHTPTAQSASDTGTSTPSRTPTPRPTPTVEPTSALIDGAMHNSPSGTAAASSLGDLCISYYDRVNGDLRFTCRNSYGNWTAPSPNMIDSEGDVGLFSSLTFDSHQQPWISYYDRGNSALKLIAQIDGQWVSETVDNEQDTGKFTSLAIGPDNLPVIAYYSVSRGVVRLAQATRSGWVLRDVETIGSVKDSFRISLALTAGGQPVLAYRSPLDTTLKLAWLNGDTFDKEYVDKTTNTGTYCSLALYPDGSPAVSYYDIHSKNLKFAVKHSGRWEIQYVDRGFESGEYTSLVIGPDGTPSISYFDEHNDDLRFARLVGTTWYPQTLDQDQRVGQYTALAIDSKGRAAIVYLHITAQTMRVVERAGVSNAWGAPRTVDSYLDTELYPSIKFRLP